VDVIVSPNLFEKFKRDWAMNNVGSLRRTDDELEWMLAETHDWEILGRNGAVLGRAAGLAHAIDQARRFSVSGARVAALSRLPTHDIIVFQGQINRVRESAAGNQTHLSKA
jgi:hypothetical protein